MGCTYVVGVRQHRETSKTIVRCQGFLEIKDGDQPEVDKT